ncbi:MAG: PorV/PorQ family protein, partial [Gemmatimonadaceae bacterium]
GASDSAIAQPSTYAAPFLLQPIDARVVGHGEATVADSTLGTAAMWWNPAGMARMRKREFAVHYWQNFLSNNLMLAYAVPSKALGTIGASAYVIDYGTQDVTLDDAVTIGTLTNRIYLLSASYASPVGKRFNFGLTAKNIRVRVVCNGCTAEQKDIIGNTSAIDFGAQYLVPTSLPISIGASVRNLGPRLQAKDAPQADPIPLVAQAGVQTRLPIAAFEKNKTVLDVMGDVFVSPAYKSPSIRVGADLTYQDLYSLRAGYKRLSAVDGSEGGLTVGLGLKYNSLQVDLARRFDSSSGVGEAGAPTYVSLRFVF